MSNSENFKDMSIWKKILVTICIFVLAIFPFIIIFVCIGVAIYEGISGGYKQMRSTPAGRRESNVSVFGEYLYLDEAGEDVYKIVSEKDGYDKKLVWQDGRHSYYDDDPICYVWYDTNTKQWQYWFKDISQNYGDYGWLKCDENGWVVQEDNDKWIDLPEEYDRNILWNIE